MASQLLRGLHHAHAAGIIHRDLKPDNVFLAERPDEPPMVKILDFGVSKIAAGAGSALKTLTREGTIVGTPYYMSPEQAQGFPDVDGRTDLYSVGAILFECLAGRPPHVGDVYEQVIVSICMRDAEDVRTYNPGVSAPLAQAIGRALSRERHERYPSARDMLDGLLGAAPAELRTLASATPSGVLRIDLGAVPAMASPAAVLASDGPATGPGNPPGLADDPDVPRQPPPTAAPTLSSRAEGPPRGSSTPVGATTLPSGLDPSSPRRAASPFSATVRVDSGVISVGPATPAGEGSGRASAGRTIALAAAAVVLVAAMAVIGVAALRSDEPRAESPAISADPRATTGGTAAAAGSERASDLASGHAPAQQASEPNPSPTGAAASGASAAARGSEPSANVPAATKHHDASAPTATASAAAGARSTPPSSAGGGPAPKPTGADLTIQTE
jgi:serine/threonine-protein kinase